LDAREGAAGANLSAGPWKEGPDTLSGPDFTLDY